MKLRELGEFGLIEKIRRSTPKARGLLLGIGDDAAWIRLNTRSLLVTSDLLVQQIHFDFKWTSPYSLGYKSLAVNLSDIAAMGGKPAYLLLSLGIPANFSSQAVQAFYRGMRFLAARSGVALVGGDTSVARVFFVSVCLIGYAPDKPVSRGGGRVGDDLYVTGTVGDSALALELLKRSAKKTQPRVIAHLLRRHHYPAARLNVGAALAREQLATAMIDVSDGLVQDLSHICRASRIGAELWEDALPLSPSYRALAGRDGTRYALTGGEDYELLFCARPEDRFRLTRLQGRSGVPITRIGRCVSPGKGIRILDSKGQRRSINIRGHDHFKRKK